MLVQVVMTDFLHEYSLPFLFGNYAFFSPTLGTFWTYIEESVLCKDHSCVHTTCVPPSPPPFYLKSICFFEHLLFPWHVTARWVCAQRGILLVRINFDLILSPFHVNKNSNASSGLVIFYISLPWVWRKKRKEKPRMNALTSVLPFLKFLWIAVPAVLSYSREIIIFLKWCDVETLMV